MNMKPFPSSSRHLLRSHDPNGRRLLGFGSPSVEYKRPTETTYDYEQKYAPDPEYKEMGPTARVWRTYLDESQKFDEQRVAEWRDVLDVLLVFSSLFTMVIATLVSRTSQNLKINYKEVMSILMGELVEVNRAILDGRSVNDVSRSDTTFVASQANVWINGLWFTSFALSFLIAIVCMLAKQWLRQYMSFTSGDPRDCARIRHYRHMALEKWRVPAIINLLPILMHLALGMFFAGLNIFIWGFSTPMAIVFAAVFGTVFIAYAISTLLPVIFPECPYKTCLSFLSFSVVSTVNNIFIRKAPGTDGDKIESLLDLEKMKIMGDAKDIDVQALSWLHDTSANDSVRSLIAQTLLHHNAPEARVQEEGQVQLVDVSDSASIAEYVLT